VVRNERPNPADARDEAREAAEQAQAAAEEAREAAADTKLARDVALDRREAGADEDNPFGLPGQPLSRRSPFRIGFTGALGVAMAYFLVQGLIQARQVLILIVVSMFLAVGLNPAVEALQRRGLRRRWAVVVVFASVILFFLAFGAAVLPPLGAQVTQFIQSAPGYLDQLQGNRTIDRLDEQFRLIDRARSYLASGDVGARAFGGLVGVGRVVLSTTFSTLTVLILTLYFLSSLPNIKRTAYRLAPRSRRARVGLLADEILLRVGGYVGGALTIAAIAGLSSYVFLTILDLRYALALAMLVTITDLIPLVGATIGAVAVTTVGFFHSVPIGIACLVFYVIYQQVENYLIYPRVMKRSVDVAPAVTVVAALVGGTLLGFVGALLAIPSAAAVQLILEEVVMPRQDQT
jgi:predicted PurR-regulated permease PerM